jgi:hypothetical protein
MATNRKQSLRVEGSGTEKRAVLIEIWCGLLDRWDSKKVWRFRVLFGKENPAILLNTCWTIDWEGSVAQLGSSQR